MLDYRITTFLTLYREMNYRKTAEYLNMTQPGVTQHIHFLEEHYGVKLFVYDGRQLHRTEEAALLKGHIDSVLARERMLREKFDRPRRKMLDVGATKTIGEFILPPVLKRFLENPDHGIRFAIDNTQTLLQMLEDSALDFAVIEGVYDRSRYGSTLYKKEAFVGVCAADHPFAGKTVRLRDCFDWTLILRETGSGTRRILEQAVEDRGYSLKAFRRTLAVSNFSVILDLVAGGDAITFGYVPIAEGRPGLATFAVEELQISGEFNLVYCDREAAREKVCLFFGEDLLGT